MDGAATARARFTALADSPPPSPAHASRIAQGFLDYLTGPSLDAKILRDNFIFKVVPMLNPDGVVVGSYRCSLAGTDLNRSWLDPSRKLHPTIYHTKQVRAVGPAHGRTSGCEGG